MKINALLKQNFSGKVRFRQHDIKTRKAVSAWSDWHANMVLDSGLNALANSQTFPGLIQALKVGSGTNPNSFNTGGTAVFTQVANTVTCTGTTFFTSAMVGGILKYGASGSAGAEQYIASVNVGAQTCVVSGAGMTVSTPTAGTVWMVQQTALQSFIVGSQSYSGISGSNGFTLVGNAGTLFLTYVFAPQGSTMSINEVGYGQTPSDGSCFGRIALGSTITVPTTNFLVAELQLTITASPSAPASVANNGTNFNNAGEIMQQVWDSKVTASNGGSTSYQTGSFADSNIMDLASTFYGSFHLANDVTPAGSISAGPVTQVAEGYTLQINRPTNSGQPVGVAVSTTNFNFNTNGETCYALVFGKGTVAVGSNGNGQSFVLVLTTPQVLPVGSFQGSMNWTSQFSRTLSN